MLLRILTTSTSDADFPSSSATIQYSFRLFLQLFSVARPDSDLLHDLSLFPFDLFIKHMFDGWLPIFSLVPLLFDWIEKQVPLFFHAFKAD